jgi:hypothetical protein
VSKFPSFPARLVSGLALILACAPETGLAHGFAQRYDLPVPLNLYLAGAAATVAFSFLLIAFFAHGERSISRYPAFNLLSTLPGKLLFHPLIVQLLRMFSVMLLLLVILAGYFGDENPFKNIAPTATWVIWWVGFAYISGLLGDLWRVINPWNAVFSWVERLWDFFSHDGRFGLRLAWPDSLGCWPGAYLFAGFVWAELIWPESDAPSSLAEAILVYSMITWLGMFLFGRKTWLRNGEAFTIVFGFLARFSITGVAVANTDQCGDCRECQCHSASDTCTDCLACFELAPRKHRKLNLRFPAVGLLAEKPISVSSMVFVLIMLSSVTFDGLLSTPVWAELANWMIYSETMRPLLVALQDITGNAVAAVGTIALVVFLVIFQLLYLLFSSLMFACTPASARGHVTVFRFARIFVLSLVPIALAYHLAHYLSYLAIVGQYIIPLSSDPFGFGWDLFGTSFYFVDISVVNARMIWYTSVVAIVAGHVVAVWLAHVMALRLFRDRRAALLSQIPMLILMVAYTMLSLWILAQPVVETG